MFGKCCYSQCRGLLCGLTTLWYMVYSAVNTIGADLQAVQYIEALLLQPV